MVQYFAVCTALYTGLNGGYITRKYTNSIAVNKDQDVDIPKTLQKLARDTLQNLQKDYGKCHGFKYCGMTIYELVTEGTETWYEYYCEDVLDINSISLEEPIRRVLASARSPRKES